MRKWNACNSHHDKTIWYKLKATCTCLLASRSLLRSVCTSCLTIPDKISIYLLPLDPWYDQHVPLASWSLTKSACASCLLIRDKIRMYLSPLNYRLDQRVTLASPSMTRLSFICCLVCSDKINMHLLSLHVPTYAYIYAYICVLPFNHWQRKKGFGHLFFLLLLFLFLFLKSIVF